jgi:hypothetical protein
MRGLTRLAGDGCVHVSMDRWMDGFVYVWSQRGAGISGILGWIFVFSFLFLFYDVSL